VATLQSWGQTPCQICSAEWLAYQDEQTWNLRIDKADFFHNCLMRTGREEAATRAKRGRDVSPGVLARLPAELRLPEENQRIEADRLAQEEQKRKQQEQVAAYEEMQRQAKAQSDQRQAEREAYKNDPVNLQRAYSAQLCISRVEEAGGRRLVADQRRMAKEHGFYHTGLAQKGFEQAGVARNVSAQAKIGLERLGLKALSCNTVKVKTVVACYDAPDEKAETLCTPDVQQIMALLPQYDPELIPTKH